jgi:hypothetical protein
MIRCLVATGRQNDVGAWLYFILMQKVTFPPGTYLSELHHHIGTASMAKVLIHRHCLPSTARILIEGIDYSTTAACMDRWAVARLMPRMPMAAPTKHPNDQHTLDQWCTRAVVAAAALSLELFPYMGGQISR